METWIADNNLNAAPSLQKLSCLPPRHADMGGLLRNLTLGGKRPLAQRSKTYASDAVTLMTLTSKGLNSGRVLCGLTQGLLPFTAGAGCDMDEEGDSFCGDDPRAKRASSSELSRAPRSCPACLRRRFRRKRGGAQKTAAEQISLF